MGPALRPSKAHRGYLGVTLKVAIIAAAVIDLTVRY